MAIAAALAVALFGIAVVTLQNAGVHRRVDHEHTVGDWSNYDEDQSGPLFVRPNVPSIFTTLTASDAGVW